MNQLGKAATWMMTNPVGEEVTEGTIGGLIYGSGGLGTDQPLEETAAKTLGAIAGGIALGMGGRRLGAMAGKAINPKALKDQEGFLSSTARLLGSETTAKGIQNQVSLGKGAIEKSLLEESSYKLLNEATNDPKGFAARYGMSPDVFKAELARVNGGNEIKAVLDTVEALPAAQRKELVDSVVGDMSDYIKTEDLVRSQAAGTFNEKLERLANVDLDKVADNLGTTSDKLKGALKDLQENKAETVTGEHVGRAIGRMAGDEVGILLGAMGAGALYDSMQGE